MGSTKAFRNRNGPAFNSDGSRMLPYKRDPVDTKTKTITNNSNPVLTIQERLQSLSLLHWRQPIDEALDLHLHGRFTFSASDSESNTDADATGKKSLDAESWTKWPQNYCKGLMNLLPLVGPETANELLTAKLATAGLADRDVGVQPWVVKAVVAEAMKRSGQKGAVQGLRKRGDGNGQRGARRNYAGRGGRGGQAGRGRGGLAK